MKRTVALIGKACGIEGNGPIHAESLARPEMHVYGFDCVVRVLY